MNEDDLNANDLDALDALNSWDGDISKALEEEDDADTPVSILIVPSWSSDFDED